MDRQRQIELIQHVEQRTGDYVSKWMERDPSLRAFLREPPKGKCQPTLTKVKVRRIE